MGIRVLLKVKQHRKKHTELDLSLPRNYGEADFRSLLQLMLIRNVCTTILLSILFPLKMASGSEIIR